MSSVMERQQGNVKTGNVTTENPVSPHTDTVETARVTTEKPVLRVETTLVVSPHFGCWPASVGMSDYIVHIPPRNSRTVHSEQLE